MSANITISLEAVREAIKADQLAGNPNALYLAVEKISKPLIFAEIANKNVFQLFTQQQIKNDLTKIPQALLDDAEFMDMVINSSGMHDGLVFKNNEFLGVLVIKLRYMVRPSIWLTAAEFSLLEKCRDKFKIQFLLAPAEQLDALNISVCEYSNCVINIAQEKFKDLGKQTDYSSFRIHYPALMDKMQEEQISSENV